MKFTRVNWCVLRMKKISIKSSLKGLIKCGTQITIIDLAVGGRDSDRQSKHSLMGLKIHILTRNGHLSCDH